MHDALAVRSRQSAAGLQEHGDEIAGGERSLLPQLFLQADAPQELHHNVECAVGKLIEVEGADDVGVLQRHLDARLAPEARDLGSIDGGRPAQHLHGHLVADTQVLGSVDGADSARRDGPQHAVFAAQHCVRQVGRVGLQLPALLQVLFERNDTMSLAISLCAFTPKPRK